MRLQTPSTQSTDGQIVSEKYDPFFGMESGRCRRLARKDAYVVGAVILSVCGALIGLFFLGFFASYDHGRLLPPHLITLKSQSVPDATLHIPSKEAYVLFLPSVQREEYLLGCRVLIYGYKHDPETRDLTRDLIVMTTPQVPLHIEDQLRSEGAIVIRHDLITSIPNPHDVNGTHPWKDQFNKLLIWNMTQYERVLYHDSDMLLVKSISDIWKQDFARPAGGLTATYQGDESDDYLNGGWLLIRPNRTMFEELLLVRDWNSHWINDVEQGLMNKYFHRDGAHPWNPLPEKSIWIANTHNADLSTGVHMVHEKVWQDIPGRWGVLGLWRVKMGKMLGYWDARREFEGGGTESAA